MLHALSMGPLQQLKGTLDALVADAYLSSDEKLLRLNAKFIQFFLDNKSMYAIFFESNFVMTNEEEAELPIHRLRNQIFNIIVQLLRTQLNLPEGEQLLHCSRIYFYMLRGIVGTYSESEESVESIMGRLSTTFDHAFEALMLGFGMQLQERKNEG